MRKWGYIFGVSVILLLGGCGRSMGEEQVEKITQASDAETEVLHGAGWRGIDFCIMESGMLYVKDGQMRYYDFAGNDSYVLCTKLNCSHRDEACSAYVPLIDMEGLAYYREHVYYFWHDREKGHIELVRMELSGENKETVWSQSVGEYATGSWVISGVPHNVYYSGGAVWFVLSYCYIDERNSGRTTSDVCAVIDLDNGVYTAISETAADETVEYNTISGRDAVWTRRRNRIKMLSEDEFLKKWEAGEFSGQISDVSDPYGEYYIGWYERNKEPEYTYYCYNLDTGRSRELETRNACRILDDEGAVLAYCPDYIFLGRYQGKWLYELVDYERNDRVYLWDADTGEKTGLLELENGGIIGRTYGMIDYGIFDNSCFLYGLFQDEQSKITIYRYDLKTGDSKKLFEDVRNITFRIIGDTPEYFIGNVYDQQNTANVKTYMIRKEDYFAGNMDQTIRIRP